MMTAHTEVVVAIGWGNDCGTTSLPNKTQKRLPVPFTCESFEIDLETLEEVSTNCLFELLIDFADL